MIKLATAILMACFFGGCVMIDSELSLKPSAAIVVSGYNRNGVNGSTAQQVATNGCQKIKTQADGGGEFTPNFDPNLPAIE